MRKELLHNLNRLISVNTIKSHFLSPSSSLPTEGSRRLSIFEYVRSGGRGRILSFLFLFLFSFSNIYADPTPWDGSVASKFASGTGTKADPYIISNAAELAYFGTKYNDSRFYYKVTKDIDLGGREWGYHAGKTFYGHLVGDKGNGAKPVISNYIINVPNSDNNYGLLGKVSNGKISNIGVSKVEMTLVANIGSALRAGTFIGIIENGALVEGCSAENITINIIGFEDKQICCGGLIGKALDLGSVVRNCSVKNCTINLNGEIKSNGNYGALLGRMENACLVEECSTENITYNSAQKLSGCNLSGMVANMQGTNATTRSVITRCSAKNITYNLEGELSDKVAIGSIVCWVQGGYNDITRCKATGLKVYMSGKLTATGGNDIRLGGMVAKLEAGAKVTDCLLYGVNYIGAKPGITGKKFSDGICMNVGGVVGSTVNQSNSSGSQIVIERCVAYCDFDFTGYTSATAGKFKGNEFVIGGVVGRLYNPYYIPNTLYYSGKVKAPYCVVGPLVGTFQKDNSKDDFIHSDYSGTNNTRANAASYANWYYGDYQIWLTSDLINSGKTRNGGYTAEGYATIGDVSTWTVNKIGTATKASKTILRYTSNGSNADLSIYPAYTATSGFPEYYMYYAQGVNRGSYQNNINTVLAALREGEDSPVWDVDATGKIVMDRFVATERMERMKATDAFTSILTVQSDDGSALPSGYTYEWKVDGTTIGTGSSIETPRGMEAKTATVHISNGGSPVGVRTVTIPRKEWYDFGSMASAPTGNGTAESPYQIATASDLAWMGYHVSETDAENKEHYVLTADIDLGNAWWSPMNGMEETGVGAFAGMFDGQGHTISNLHIDWDVNYAAAANFGLFSIIKGTSAQWAVVKNLVIADAVVSKATNDKLWGNRCVGILAGNVKQYSQIENVIVRNSEMKASATASAQNGRYLYFGGLAGKINDNGNNYSFLNISTDVDINISNITVNTAANIAVGGVVGLWQTNAKTCVKNVYALGNITVPSGPTNIGSVFGQNTTGLTTDATSTIFYVNAARQNVGTRKVLSDYATTFLATANETVKAREDLYPWVYSQTPGYGLSNLKMEVVDNNAGQPRLDEHTLEIKGLNLDAYTYEWYRNDVKIGEGTTINITPVLPSDEVSLRIDVLKNGVKEGSLSAAAPMLMFAGSGTSANDPYLIGHKEELLLLSYLSNQPGTYGYYGKTTADYNQAYYLLDADVDLTGVTDFIPIGSVKDNYQAENCFRGHFDGKGLSIRNMQIQWKAGDVNAEVNRVWGLFGAVQGVSNTQKAVIQNLIIKNAVLTHDTGNTSFYYNGTSGTANNCYVGVLAGVVGTNATIQNIEVSNCSITDEGSTQYGVAKHTLSVGGIIGRSQYSFASDAGDMNTTTTIRLVVSDCDITINSARFEGATSAEQFKVDVAGVIGSMKSNGASATMPWPNYTYYTGKVKAMGKAMVSPVFSCAEFRNNTRSDFDYYCNLYVGRINSSDANPVSNIFYDNRYQIYYDGSYRDITDTYPAVSNNNAQRNPCDMGARTIQWHSYYDTKWHHNKDLKDYYFQGVNYGAYVDQANASAVSTVAETFSTGRSEATNNDEIKAFGFTFGTDGKLHLGEVFDITFTDDNLGDASKIVHTLTITNKLGDEGLTYKWYVNGEEKQYPNSQEIHLGVTPQLVYAKVFRGSDLKYTTEVIELPRGYVFSADYNPKYDFSGSFTVTPDETFTEGGYTYSYDWQEWSDGTTTALHYTAQQCFDANRSYIESVTQGSTPVPEANWSADIYANPSNYTVTYKHIMTDVISAEEYAALSSGEQAGYEELGDGTYGKDGGEYTPLSTSDTYTSSSSGKIPLSGGETVSGATLSGANENKTYYCTVTATDAQWNTFVANHGTEDIYKDLIAKYETSFTTELTVKYIKSIIVYLHTKDTETINGKSYPSGNDENDGKTDQTPVRTWQKAYSLLKENALWDENYIVLIGTSSREATCDQTGGNKGFSITSSLQGNAVSETYVQWKAKVDASHLAKNTTITGMWEGVDYGGVIEAYEDGTNGVRYIGLFGDTRFQNITFNHDSRAKHSSYIFCQYHNLEMGKGVQMTGFDMSSTPGYGKIDGAKTASFQIYGGLNNDMRFRTASGVLDMEAMNAAMPHGEKGFTITLKSGHYSCITMAGRQSTSNQLNGLMGTPTMPIKCKILVDIDREFNDKHNSYKNGNDTGVAADYDIGIVAASHEGPMYADMDIEIRSGYVARVASGMLGNQKNFNFNYNGVNYRFPDNTYMGRANILIDPKGGDDGNVIITELYGGSTGRGYSNGITIKNPFYGYSTVTINGGTFKILPESNANNDKIFCGVFGAGAGGYSGIGGGDDAHPYTPDEHIAYWSADEKVVLFGNSTAIQNKKLTKPHCYNADGSFTDVDPTLTNSNIIIKGGKFGSADHPIDGIYAGGSGFMSPSLFYEPNVVPSIYGGNIYGKAGETVSTLTITGGKFYCKNGVFAAGRGTDKYYSEKAYSGTPENYTELGLTYGDVELNINGGELYCNVYGGGAGVAEAKLLNSTTYGALTDMARLTGNSVINIGGNAKILSYSDNDDDDNVYGGNVYGGGMLAAVDGNTTVNISGNAEIEGNVFGAAQGITNDVSINTIPHTLTPYLLHTPENATLFGLVNGNTVIKTSGNPSINGDIYGGAESAITNGSTSITLNGCTLNGNIYGGGLGALTGGTLATTATDAQVTASADIKGTTYIKVDKVDYASSSNDYYLYGGGNMASKVEGKTEIIVNDCTTKGQMSVYGGGYGTMAPVSDTYITVNDFTTKEGDYGLATIFGGGNAGPVSGGATISLNGGQVFGDVFGGGNVASVGTKYPANGTDEEKEDYLRHYANLYGSLVTMQGVGPVVYGNIYGGGNKADIYGNAVVNISNGAFAGEVFGGGNGDITTNPISYANVIGSTSVYIDGATVIWNRKWDRTNKLFFDWNGVWGGSNYAMFLAGSASAPIFLNNHNIYGGGNHACRVVPIAENTETGIASVEVTKGFCGLDLLSTDVWKKAYNDSKNPHFYVFGGGYGAYTSVEATKVNVAVNEYTSEGATTDMQLAKPAGLTFNAKSNAPRKRITSGEGTDNATIGVYDNSYGIPDYTVLGVLGGGYAGLVIGDTDVKVGGNTYMHRVYGGGYGQLEAYTELQQGAAIYEGKTRENLGEVGGNATVLTDGGYIYGDVFGGGAGVESAKLSGNTYTDFKDMGRVVGTTSVTISGNTQVFGSVYGGGDVANVGVENTPAANEPKSRSIFDVEDMFINRKRYEYAYAQSFVNVIGGDIFGEVFAGGNGRMKSEASDYTTLGRVEGNTLVHVADDALADGRTIVPTIWNRIFGGCSYGTVNGNTLVHIEGGMLGHNIFGGGLGDAADDAPEAQTNGSYADIKGSTTVKIDGGKWLWNQMADTQGNIIVWKDAPQVVVNDIAELRNMSAAKFMGIISKYADSRFFNIDATTGKCNFVIAHNIFGGGKDACNVTGKATVKINHSPLSRLTDDEGNNINLLDEKTVGGLCWYASISNINNPQFSVFGGGWGINTRVGETDVYVGPGARFNDTGEKLVLKPYGNDVADTNLRYDAVNEENDELFYFTIAPGDLGKEPYAYINEDISEYVIFENDLLDDFDTVSPEERIRLYGSADGGDTDTHTFLRYRASRLAMSLGAPTCTFMDIHGGGFSGYVTGNTKVVTDGQLACRNVFGGGLGSLPANPTGNETYGEVGGNTSVRLHSGFISLDVFGGGAGVESYKNGGTFIDFPNIARVKGKTEVEVWGEPIAMKSDIPNPNGEGNQTYDKERVLVFGNVYGGGDVANVGVNQKGADVITLDNYEGKDFTTSVSVYGGGVFSSVYAGGNGRPKNKCKDYTQLGAVYGNTRFYVENTKRRYPYVDDQELANPVIPYLWNRLYGGCQNGTVYGNTFVDINGGYILYNIFGGGVGTVDSLNVNGVMKVDENNITSANVTGNTNILIRDAVAKVNSLWDAAKRTWVEAKVVNKNGETRLYSPQYDPSLKKFNVNHNIYGGGRNACIVEGSTYITMTKGMLPKDHEVVSGVSTADIGGFFNTNEWTEIYNKVGSPHFCLFGGGYGEKTVVNENTYVNVSLGKEEKSIAEAEVLDDVANLSSHFYDRQGVMDVVGGGYSGSVRGMTNVTIGGETFLRRVFGGGFYSPVGAATININKIDCAEIFGGGLMGDIGYTDASEYCESLAEAKRGMVTLNVGTNSGNTGESIWVHKNVYGGNDVSGDILNKTQLNIAAGHIFGNVYGAGNGDYLYAVGRNKEKKVTVNEYYKVGKNTYDLVYTVPSRSFMASLAASSAPQRMVNCASYHPKVQNVEINLSGPSALYPLEIGGVFGGGNSATVNNLNGNDPTVKFHFGSNLKLNNVFMGCDGEALFDSNEKFRKAYEDVNSLHLEDGIDWLHNPANHAITEQYLPVSHENRPKVYEHLLDLYFQPVEMDVQPEVTWADDMTNVTIGSFYCGGNRGNMNVEPDENGEIVRYTFPENLVITDKIVGGCNKANYEMPNSRIKHRGGYLLGVRGKNAINLEVKCQFDPHEETEIKEGGNVYGGCYASGTIFGDVYIDLKSDMLSNVSSAELASAKADNKAVCNVYGAGYGSQAYVHGNTKIDFGKDIRKTDNNGHGTTANYVYGGGHQGNLVGNSNVRIYNGHIASSICGGSYSGMMWGSSQVLVGYPKYYTVNKSGTYALKRVDKWNDDARNVDGSEVVKKSIKLLEGDIVAEEVYDAIYSHDNSQGSNFTLHTTAPANWSDIDIRIDEAIYGGGYALAAGSSVAAGSTTVKKYSDTENIDEYMTASELAALGADGTKGYGGNTTLIVWDAPTAENYETDHISVSSQSMKEKTIHDGESVFGYYYMDLDGNYKYIYQEDYTKDSPQLLELATKDADGKPVIFEYDGDGGMFGDGHLSFAEGFRCGELCGYGFAEKTPEHARIVNSFQRMDMLRLTDCAVVLLGARDYTINEISATPYSIARVGEIQMIAQNVKYAADGKLAGTSVKRSRNYLGMSNNIHYLGALYSNVKFTDSFRDAAGAVYNEKSYLDVKQEFIDNRQAKPDRFKQRNTGTAANMIGIASGYALKIHNVKAAEDDTEKLYYGPVVGIIEMALVDVHTDEGGGYVYAKNIHSRPPYSASSPAKGNAPLRNAVDTDPVEITGDEDFLQTSGNFVFPYNDVQSQYIVDDCFSHGYDAQNTLAVKDDVHYWYVTGRHYYYNTSITGYTYDSTTTPLLFDADNGDALMNLVGTPAGSTVTLKKVTWRSAHTDGYKDDLEKVHENGEYVLRIGASSKTIYDEAVGAYIASLPMHGENENLNTLFTNTTDGEAANILLQLEDKADNSGTGYFYQHLSEPCKATIELETKDANNQKCTYTIYLTINYVQGPNVTGALQVLNCALPGEMIEINKGTIQMTADQSMAQSATIYRIGPLQENGELSEYPYSEDHPEGYFTYEVGNPYAVEKGLENTTSEMLAGVVFDESNTTNPSIRVPAYYFMNGYGVQYCFKVSGLNEIFPVAMDENSRLEIHNYHRMEPRRSGGGIYEGKDALDLHIALAAKRAHDHGTPEPRIYIEDATDVARFISFINEKTDDAAEIGSKNDFGANMQFFLQDNIHVETEYVVPDNFKGTLNGDGHVITGVHKENGLFKALDSSANIYNLGLASGRFVVGSSSADNPSLHCCYEYANNIVYRMDGTAYTGYTDADWRYGKVAYDLNEYYLDKRFGDGSKCGYVDNIYANGDYLYAGYEFENHYDGSEYIRNSYIPNYGYTSSAHDATHPVDESRAVRGEGGTVTYHPLLDENKIEDGPQKNDYLFFGQILDALTKGSEEAVANATIPAPMAADEESSSFHLVTDMNNRVYRAGGYYGSKENIGFHYNSDAYIHDNGITAIDFYGYNEPVNDYGMESLTADDGVTRNLLLYARLATDRAGILNAFSYDDTTPESAIKAHVIDQAATPTTEYLHLVERTLDNRNGEGNACYNNDFNCPIAFRVTSRAWYTRAPRYYANNRNDAWEGISLPFSVNRVEASFNGEITHFYGSDDSHAANETEANITNVGHEYWLRGLVSCDLSQDTKKATFSRPGNAEGLFAGGTLAGSYTYSNPHFHELYGAIYGDNGFSIYDVPRTFNDYLVQQANVPYIVSFPGAEFKEFDLSGDYNQALLLGSHEEWDALVDAHGFSFQEAAMKPQNITFSWICDNNKVAETIDGAATIGITDDSYAPTTVGNVSHHATFAAMDRNDTYVINEYGTAFDSYIRRVFPFRTYMTVDASPAKAFAKPRSILISNDGGIQELPQQDDAGINGLRIWSENRKIFVESPDNLSLELYTATGQLVRILDVVPGTNTYSGFTNGIYIIGQKKLYVK